MIIKRDLAVAHDATRSVAIGWLRALRGPAARTDDALLHGSRRGEADLRTNKRRRRCDGALRQKGRAIGRRFDDRRDLRSSLRFRSRGGSR